MKILITGGTHAHALELVYYNRLRKILPEHTVQLYPISNHLSNLLAKGIPYKIAFRLNLPRLYKAINDRLLQYVEDYKPDLVLVFKGMEILPHTLHVLLQKGIKLVNYNADHPLYFTGPGSGNKNVTNSIPLYHLHITYHPFVQAAFNEKNIPNAFLPFGYDDEMINIRESLPLEDNTTDAVFIGNPDKQRVAWIQEMVRNDIPLHLYGHGWEKYHLTKHCFGPVYGEAFIETARKYRIHLNIFRQHNAGAHNMRTIELGAIGVLQLSTYSEQVQSFYGAEPYIFSFSKSIDVSKGYHRMKSISSEEALQIKQTNREKLVLNKFSYTALTHQLIQLLNGV